MFGCVYLPATVQYATKILHLQDLLTERLQVQASCTIDLKHMMTNGDLFKHTTPYLHRRIKQYDNVVIRNAMGARGRDGVGYIRILYVICRHYIHITG